MHDYLTQQIPRGSDFYYSLLRVSHKKRPYLTALYVLSATIRTIPITLKDPGVARLKLAWWGSEIERLFQGEPTHPMTLTLLPLVQDKLLSKNLLDALVQAVYNDLLAPTIEDDDVLKKYILATWLPYTEVSTAILVSDGGYAATPLNPSYTMDLALGLGLTELIQQHGQYLRCQKNYLPGPIEKHTIEAKNTLLAAKKTATLHSSVLRHHLALIDMAIALLACIEEERFDVAQQHIALTPLRKLWLAWKN